MSLESLEAALCRAAIQIRPGQAHYPSLFAEDGITSARHLPHWLVEPILREIEGTSELLEFAHGWIRTPHSGQRLSPWKVANALAQRLFAGIPPHQIVSETLDLATNKVCDTWTYIGLYGGGILERIELAEGISIMPAGVAPPSLARELIFGINRWGNPIMEEGFPRWKPNIALLISGQTEIFRDESQPDHALFHSLAEKAQLAIRASTLAGGYPFVRSWQMSWIVHPAIPYEGFGGWGAGGSFDAIPQPTPRTPEPIDPDLARQLYCRLQTLKPAVKSAIELATDRLGRSRTHAPSPDTALDLGIASEVILLHGEGNSELKYRFSIRGAYLLGKDGPDRALKHESFRALYDARSEAAHHGTLKQKWRDRLPEFDSLCAAAIRAIVHQQQFPNWDSLTLGSDD